MKIEPKSLLIGLGAGVVCTLLMAAASSPNTTPGRYAVSATDSHGIIIDTQTGDAWSHYLPATGGTSSGGRFFQPKTGASK